MSIRNFRGIDHLDLRFVADEERHVVTADLRPAESERELPQVESRGAPWTMLIGENGHGKSSVLQAVALALMGREARAALPELLGADLGMFVRDTDSRDVSSSVAGITVELTEGTRSLKIHRDGSWTVDGDDDGAYVVAGYGAGRVQPLVPVTSVPAAPEGPRVENLFSPHSQLAPIEPWLRQVRERSPEAFDYVCRALASLVNQPAGTVVVADERVAIRQPTGNLATLRELSDGYRAMLALGTDVMSFLVGVSGVPDQAEGVVLIDEIDAHLHPRWQMRVVDALRSTFPNVQFIVTTHSPLCMRGIEDGEAVVMQRTESGEVYALTGDELPNLTGLDVGQLLTSEFFGLSSTVSPELEEKLRAYQDYLGRNARGDERDLSPEEQAGLAQTRRWLEEAGQLGATARERLALYAVDQRVAAIRNESAEERRNELRADLRARLEQVWAGEFGPSGAA